MARASARNAAETLKRLVSQLGTPRSTTATTSSSTNKLGCQSSRVGQRDSGQDTDAAEQPGLDQRQVLALLRVTAPVIGCSDLGPLARRSAERVQGAAGSGYRERLLSGPIAGQPGTPSAMPAVRPAPASRTRSNSIGDYVGLVALALLVYGETEDPLATTRRCSSPRSSSRPSPRRRSRPAWTSFQLRRVLAALYVGEAVVLRASSRCSRVVLARPWCSRWRCSTAS